jgi:hypothetical protein
MLGDEARPHTPRIIRSKSHQQFVPFKPGGHGRDSFPNRPDRKVETVTAHPVVQPDRKLETERGRPRALSRHDHGRRKAATPAKATRTHRGTAPCGDASTSRGPRQPEFVRVLSEREAARDGLGPAPITSLPLPPLGRGHRPEAIFVIPLGDDAYAGVDTGWPPRFLLLSYMVWLISLAWQAIKLRSQTAQPA